MNLTRIEAVLVLGGLSLLSLLACSGPKEESSRQTPAPNVTQSAPDAGSKPAQPVAVETKTEPVEYVLVPEAPQEPESVQGYEPNYPKSHPADEAEALAAFAPNAFPPLLPPDSSHAEAWLRDQCLNCHQTGVNNAPRVAHRGMSKELLAARCRSCHLPDNRAIAEREAEEQEKALFARNAFPPMLPANEFHTGAWQRQDCMGCHRNAVYGAPPVRHAGMSWRLMEANCRTCHVASSRSFVPVVPEEESAEEK